MFQLLKRCDQRKGSIATVEFEGDPVPADSAFPRAADSKSWRSIP